MVTTSHAQARKFVEGVPYSINDNGRDSQAAYDGRAHIILNSASREHQRQGVKCLNAYPEDHARFSRCIDGKSNAASPSSVQRPLLMPLPVNTPYHDYRE